MRFTRSVVDRLAGQTPCLCGSIDTWHPRCYAGKSNAQVQEEMSKAYRMAAAELRRRYQASVDSIIAVVSK